MEIGLKFCFTHGKGINLWDTEGKKYYDFFSGIAVNALGHAHPKIVQAISNQASRLIHCSSLYYIESQAKLSKKLVEISCMDKVFFANSGAEANEAALKLAKIYFKKKSFKDKYEIITLKNSFHGRTLATVAATGQEKYQKNYTPLPQKFVSVPINNIEALKKAVSNKTCAIMLEPIQGESGVYPLDSTYLKEIRKICDKNNILLIFDEIQTGIGRTGKMFAYEHYDVEPDIMTLAKALGGGVPIGALCAKASIASAFEPGDHGSTFGGNPLACETALAVLDVMYKDSIIDNANSMGKYFIDQLLKIRTKPNSIKEVRGIGLMIGIELSLPCAKEIKTLCFEHGYLIGSVEYNILRILPPLIISKDDIDGFIEMFRKII